MATTVSTPTTTQVANTTGLTIPNPLEILIPGLNETGVGGSSSSFTTGIFNDIGTWFTSALGLPTLKDAMQRLGLILFGAVLIIVGLIMLSKGPAVVLMQDTVSAGKKAATVAEVA